MKRYKPKPIKPSERRRYESNCGNESVEAVVRPNVSYETAGLYEDFVAWMNYKKVTSEQFRYITHRYYNEFIGGL